MIDQLQEACQIVADMIAKRWGKMLVVLLCLVAAACTLLGLTL